MREAFELSLDREVINKVVFFGEVVPGCSTISPVSKLEPDLKCPGRDVERAKELLEESGVKKPVELPLMVEAELADDPARRGRAGDGQGGGLRGQGAADRVHHRAGPRRRGRLRRAGRRLVGARGPGRQPFNHQSSTGPLNYAGAADEGIDDQLNAARAESDPEKRKERYRRLAQEVRGRRSTIVLYHDNLVLGARQGISGVEFRTDGLPRLSFAE